MSKERQHYTAAEKIAALRRHHLDKEPVSALCTELCIAPSMFYRWQKDLFEGGAQVFVHTRNDELEKRDRRISELEAKLVIKNEVVSELLEEHVRLKKAHGEA
jgi:transposase-like protein